MKGWDKQVPFTEDGTLVIHVKNEHLNQGVVAGKDPIYYEPFVWKDNFTFKAVLELVGMTRGRSAARFVWSDKDGLKYEMFMKDMFELVKSHAVIERGHCEAEWTFVKRGANFGVTASVK